MKKARFKHKKIFNKQLRELNDQKALGTIHQDLDDTIFQKMSNTTTSKQACNFFKIHTLARTKSKKFIFNL